MSSFCKHVCIVYFNLIHFYLMTNGVYIMFKIFQIFRQVSHTLIINPVINI